MSLERGRGGKGEAERVRMGETEIGAGRGAIGRGRSREAEAAGVREWGEAGREWETQRRRGRERDAGLTARYM